MTELAPRIRRGTVTGFDESAGLGTIVTDDGTDLPFHCIVIADGSRTIEVGATVTYSLIAKLGRYEAADIRPG